MYDDFMEDPAAMGNGSLKKVHEYNHGLESIREKQDYVKTQKNTGI